MNAPHKILVLAAVLAGILASVAPAGPEDAIVDNGLTISSSPQAKQQYACTCGCKDQKLEHERRHNPPDGID